MATIVAEFGDCRQNRRLSSNSATVAGFATVAVFGEIA